MTASKPSNQSDGFFRWNHYWLQRFTNNVVTQGQQYNTGEKPTVILFLKFLQQCDDNNNVISVQYNDGLLPDIILLTQCYYYRETRLNAMKRFCICSL